MVSRSTLAVSLVIVALLAGCSGLIGDGGPESPEDIEVADGYAADGITDGDRATESHRRALANKSSYTVEYQQNVTGGENSVTYDAVYRVDVEGERAYHSVSVLGQNTSVKSFYESDTMSLRRSRAGQVQVTSRQTEFNVSRLTGVETISPLLSNETEYETSVAERDGTSVVVYETSGTESANRSFGMAEENVSSFQAEFSVDTEGLVHHADYELTVVGDDGGEQTLTLSYELQDVDQTTVERPTWVNES